MKRRNVAGAPLRDPRMRRQEGGVGVDERSDVAIQHPKTLPRPSSAIQRTKADNSKESIIRTDDTG